MIQIEFVNNFEETDKIADKLLSEYDNENNVKYNFNKFSFIAKQNDITVGYLTGFSCYSEVTISNLVVLKKYRRKGIGTELIKQVENHFKNKGFNNINLVTHEFQAPDFYKNAVMS